MLTLAAKCLNWVRLLCSSTGCSFPLFCRNHFLFSISYLKCINNIIHRLQPKTMIFGTLCNEMKLSRGFTIEGMISTFHTMQSRQKRWRWYAAQMVFKEDVKIIQVELSRVTTRNTTIQGNLNWYLVFHS